MRGIPAADTASPDAAVAWHYGDPFAEQRWLAAGRGAVDLSHRDVIEVSGVDRLSWLDSMTSQLLLGLTPGASTYDLLLDAHGRVESEMHLVDDGERTLITVEPGNGQAARDFLDRMRFMLRVEVHDVTDAYAVVWEPVRERHASLPTILTPAAFAGLPMGDVGADVSKYTVARHEPWRGREVLVPRAELDAYLDGVGELAGSWAWNALRVAAGVPRFGVETDDKTIPHEVGWLGTAVHMKKGCYRGQETVARTHNMGKPPRRLVLLHLDGSRDDLPAHGAPVMLGEKQIGFIGMSVQHHELGPIASAVVKRNTPADERLTVDGMQAGQELVVTA